MANSRKRRKHTFSSNETFRTNSFFRLPTELIQHVAYFLPTNTDRRNLALSSSDLASQILPPESHIWRKLFRDTYDEVGKRTPVDYKIEYQIRAIALFRPVDFGYGQKERQTFWLEQIRMLFYEGLLQQNGAVPGKNFECIRKALANSEFLNRPVSGYRMSRPDPPSSLFLTTQLLLTYLVLDPTMSVCCLRTDYDMATIYARPDARDTLFDEHNALSLETALGIRNFWLRHLLSPDEDTFYTAYTELPSYLIASPPNPLGLFTPQTVPTSWLGFEACFCPFLNNLDDLHPRQTCADMVDLVDCVDQKDEIEHITVELEGHPDPENWPQIFMQCVARYKGPCLYFRGTQTYHGSRDNRSYAVRGFIEATSENTLCNGWMRICWVTYVSNPEPAGPNEFFNEAWPPQDMHNDFISISRYEGVIIPGNALILGQWFCSPFDTLWEAKGPFIFWHI